MCGKIFGHKRKMVYLPSLLYRRKEFSGEHVGIICICCVSAECKEFMVRYMRCLRENAQQHAECRMQAKDYLQCRMDKYVLKRGWANFHSWVTCNPKVCLCGPQKFLYGPISLCDPGCSWIKIAYLLMNTGRIMCFAKLGRHFVTFLCTK